MTGVELVTAIVEILVSGITGIASGIGTGLSNLAQSIFLVTTGDTTTLSTFGTIIVVFAGIALAIGLSRLVVTWLTSLGGSNM